MINVSRNARSDDEELLLAEEEEVDRKTCALCLMSSAGVRIRQLTSSAVVLAAA